MEEIEKLQIKKFVKQNMALVRQQVLLNIMPDDFPVSICGYTAEELHIHAGIDKIIEAFDIPSDQVKDDRSFVSGDWICFRSFMIDETRIFQLTYLKDEHDIPVFK